MLLIPKAGSQNDYQKTFIVGISYSMPLSSLFHLGPPSQLNHIIEVAYNICFWYKTPKAAVLAGGIIAHHPVITIDGCVACGFITIDEIFTIFFFPVCCAHIQ